MKYAIISDIHSNLEALNTVLKDADARDCEKIICGGDVVGYNANPKECMNIVRGLDIPCVMGNHDEYIGQDCDLSAFNPVAAEAVIWTREQLSDEDRQWLCDLRYVRLVDHFSIVHGTMDSPKYWGYVQDVNDAAASFTYQSTNLCFHGHTHVPVVFVDDGVDIEHGTFTNLKLEPGNRYFINVGSVGQPRDRDNRACFGLFDTDSQSFEHIRVEYDIDSTADKILRAGLDEKFAKRLFVGL